MTDPLRVVVAHNFYRSDQPSGENAVVLEDVRALGEHGVDVHTFFRHSDDIEHLPTAQRAVVPLGVVHHPAAARELTALLRQVRPHVLHLHNVYPLISPAAVRVARREGVRVVQTVHNYRHSCISGDHFRRGAVCEVCIERPASLTPVLDGCYRGSRPQSLLMRSAQLAQAPLWRELDALFCLTPFMRDRLLRMGFRDEQLVLRPTSAPDRQAPDGPGQGWLYAGRLSEEKGLPDLLTAWRAADRDTKTTLTIVGAGPLTEDVQRAARQDPSLRYVGQLDGPGVAGAIDAAAALVVPSRWFEGYPRVIVEAFRSGRPVLARDIGGLRAVVADRGWLFRDDAELTARLSEPPSSTELTGRGAAAREHFRSALSSDVSAQLLVQTYERLRAHAAGASDGASNGGGV